MREPGEEGGGGGEIKKTAGQSRSSIAYKLIEKSGRANSPGGWDLLQAPKAKLSAGAARQSWWPN